MVENWQRIFIANNPTHCLQMAEQLGARYNKFHPSEYFSFGLLRSIMGSNITNNSAVFQVLYPIGKSMLYS